LTAFLFLFAPAVVLLAIVLLKAIERKRDPLGDIHLDQDAPTAGPGRSGDEATIDR
jgi:hypothetical protein